jgi:putative membrane-bound dehydrogenase-like protein
MCADLDEDGRLYVTESSGLDVSGTEMAEDPQCRIRLLVDSDADGVYDQSTVFADKLSLPMGVLSYRGGVYVASPPDFLRLEDTDGDGVSDVREVLLTGWNVLNTASLHGPFLGPDGWMYLTHGRHGYKIETKEGGILEGLAPRIWRCRPDGTELERVCGGGFDNPVEIVFTPAGEAIGTMTYFTDPKNGQRDALNHWIEGGVYPKFHESLSEFVQTGELLPSITHFARIAPAGLERYRGTAFGPEYQGNLFSAQFNPHRVQRHILTRAGASFTSEDSDFLVSSDPDFHPTDALEDADGSLIVLDTGGWYVSACPLSRISKPEFKGAIYRVRRKNAPKLEDPYGSEIDWESSSPEELAPLLADKRPFVRDKATEALVAKGPLATRVLNDIVHSNLPIETRCAAVFCLLRAGLDPARLNPDPVVTAAQLRAIRESAAPIDTDTLVMGLSHTSPVVRRESALTLGRLSDLTVSPALLEAASSTGGDPFLDHAIIDALIRLSNADAMLNALDDSRPSIRRAALIALDQSKAPGLLPAHLLSCLDASEERLRSAALWVAKHHPEWSGDFVAYFRKAYKEEVMDEERGGALGEALLAFENDTEIQSLVGELLVDPSLKAVRRLLLLDVLKKSELQKFPQNWLDALGAALEDSEPAVRWEALNSIQGRGFSEFDATLSGTASDSGEPDDLRVAAYNALVPRSSGLDAEAFEFLLSQTTEEVDPTTRLAAAKVIGDSTLTEAQLLFLAEGPLAAADGLVIPSLVNGFEGNSAEPVGLALVKALKNSEAAVNVIGGEGVETLLASYPESVKTAARPLLEKIEEERAARIERIEKLIPLLSGGDVGRGRQVFFGNKTACATCHAIGEEGGDLGPDLTAIGAIRSGRDILEAIVFPSASFVPDYEPVRIETAVDVYSGVLSRQSPDALYLRSAADSETRIERAEIVSMAPSSVSVMPEGLDSGITEMELLDLLAFLQAQNGNEWLLPDDAPELEVGKK